MWWCCGTIKNVELVSAPTSTKPTYAKPLDENTSESLQLSGTDALEVVAEKAPLVQAEAQAEAQAETEAQVEKAPLVQAEPEADAQEVQEEAQEVQEEAQEVQEEAQEEEAEAQEAEAQEEETQEAEAQEAEAQEEEAQEAQEEEAQEEEAQEEEAQEAQESDDDLSERSYNSDESDTSQLLQVEVKVIRVKRYVCSKNLKTSVSIFLFGTAAYFLANLNEFRRFFTPM